MSKLGHRVLIEEAALPDGRSGWRARCHTCWWQSPKLVRRASAIDWRERHEVEFPPDPPKPEPQCPERHPALGVQCEMFAHVGDIHCASERPWGVVVWVLEEVSQ